MSKTQIATGGIADDAVTAAKATGFGKIGQAVQGTKTTQFETTSTFFATWYSSPIAVDEIKAVWDTDKLGDK